MNTAPHRPSSCSSDLPRRKAPAPQSGPAGHLPLPPSQACKGASPVTACFFPTHRAPELSSCPRAFWVSDTLPGGGCPGLLRTAGGPAPHLRLPVWAPPGPGWPSTPRGEPSPSGQPGAQEAQQPFNKPSHGTSLSSHLAPSAPAGVSRARGPSTHSEEAEVLVPTEPPSPAEPASCDTER